MLAYIVYVVVFVKNIDVVSIEKQQKYSKNTYQENTLKL